MRRIRHAFLLIVSLIPALPAWSAAPAEGFLIVPGQSLGALRLGITVAALYQTPGWGQPNRTHTPGSVTYLYYDRHAVTVVVRENAVVMLLTTSERFRTDRGAGVGQAVSTAAAAYGQAATSGDERTLWYDAVGLVIVAGGNTIIRIGVFDPKTLVRVILADERPARDVFLTVRQQKPWPAPDVQASGARAVLVTITFKNTSRITKLLNPNFFTLIDRSGKAYRYDPSTFRQTDACRSTIAVKPGETASCSLIFVLGAGASIRSIVFNDGASVDEYFL